MTMRSSRRHAPALRIPGAAALACALLACSGGEPEPAPPSPAAPSAPAAAAPAPAPGSATLEERLATLADLYVWDEARGAARALESDVAQCHGEVRSEGLVGVAEHIRCMEGLGWKRKPGA